MFLKREVEEEILPTSVESSEGVYFRMGIAPGF